MKNDLYLEIIKKQQELINLMLQAGIGSVPQSMAIVEVGNDGKDCKELKCDLEGFSLWLKRKGMSENCIDSYIQTVDLFFREYGVMNEETLARYEVDLKEKWKPKTVNLRIAGMTKYFKYLDYNGFEFVRAKEQKKTPWFLCMPLNTIIPSFFGWALSMEPVKRMTLFICALIRVI